VNAYKFEIERINGEINKLKEQYFDRKRSNRDMEPIPEEEHEIEQAKEESQREK